LILGISTPGYGAEVFGVIAICLGLMGMGFDIAPMAIAFLIIGSILLLMEIFVTPGFGVLGIGGIICLVIGSIFLIPSYPTGWMISREYQRTLTVCLLTPTLIVAGFFGFALSKVIAIRKKKPVIGELIGEEAVAVDELKPGKTGFVRYRGEYWEAIADEEIKPNEKVLIIEKDGATLIVKKK
jgi:membrane-bound serine protease (ClpP class)